MQVSQQSFPVVGAPAQPLVEPLRYGSLTEVRRT